jgi:hypothetical protein
MTQSRHIDSMQADMGGTKIQEVLGNIFASRTGTVPTSVFLLTDGMVQLFCSLRYHSRR